MGQSDVQGRPPGLLTRGAGVGVVYPCTRVRALVAKCSVPRMCGIRGDPGFEGTGPIECLGHVRALARAAAQEAEPRGTGQRGGAARHSGAVRKADTSIVQRWGLPLCSFPN
jgi:hypothetical protein